MELFDSEDFINHLEKKGVTYTKFFKMLVQKCGPYAPSNPTVRSWFKDKGTSRVRSVEAVILGCEILKMSPEDFMVEHEDEIIAV